MVLHIYNTFNAVGTLNIPRALIKRFPFHTLLIYILYSNEMGHDVCRGFCIKMKVIILWVIEEEELDEIEQDVWTLAKYS